MVLRLRDESVERNASKLSKPSLCQWNWVSSRFSQPAAAISAASASGKKVAWTEDACRCVASSCADERSAALIALSPEGTRSFGAVAGVKGTEHCSLG